MERDISSATLRAIRRIMRASDRSGRRLAAATGLTASQVLVLQQIEKSGETTPGVIAADLQFGQATVTNIIDRLVAVGFATRRRGERDKRQMLLGITKEGREALNRAPDLLQERFVARFEALPTWEQAMMLAALERLSELLDASDIDAAPLLDSGDINKAPDNLTTLRTVSPLTSAR
ncbi:MAG: MarR family winged helix-turn-helix transcriptional regulator [Pseudomonadota bacterium]|jgi:DNA-binding MarR family transcriptional regulator